MVLQDSIQSVAARLVILPSSKKCDLCRSVEEREGLILPNGSDLVMYNLVICRLAWNRWWQRQCRSQRADREAEEAQCAIQPCLIVN